MNNDILKLFPFEKFRKYQKDVILQIRDYFESGTEVVILEGPTGFGKSPVNITLGRYFKPSFYTTPQVKLVEQLAKDFGPKKLIIDGGKSYAVPLIARNKYICKRSYQDSNICKFRNIEGFSCLREPKCTYWKQKVGVFEADIGITTFSNLIVNSYLPEFIDTDDCEIQISFKKRNLLIIDECHDLEEQIAGLHAGFVISPFKFPVIDNKLNKYTLQTIIWNELKDYIPSTKRNFVDIKELELFVNRTKDVITGYSQKRDFKKYFKNKKNIEKITNLFNKIDFMKEELKENRKWIVNLTKGVFDNNLIIIPHFKPILIDNFLKQSIWSYADKYLLTSATIPYRDNVSVWLSRLGLANKKYKFIKIPMLFPKKNRPIYLNRMGGKMTYKELQYSWNNNVKTVKEIIKKYPEQKGVIHTHSFKLMNDLYEELKDEFSVYIHDKMKLKKNKIDIIESWINSKKDILLSPSVFEGVDLKDDLCRFQILLKVPYAQIQDGRVHHLLNVKKDWNWYNNETVIKIIQAYGRAIRHMEDYADFYIIDGSFSSLYYRVEFPRWFKEAVVK